MSRHAFTLVELLVVIAIIGLLSTIAVVSLNSSKVNARNTKRKADLTQISKALEMYYGDWGGYPNTSNTWYGSCSGFTSSPDIDTLNASPANCLDLATPSWIPGLTSCGYMAKLPRDPNSGKANPLSGGNAACRTDPGNNCYIYRSNGTDFKLNADCTPEGNISSDQLRDPIRPAQDFSIYSMNSGTGGRNW